MAAVGPVKPSARRARISRVNAKRPAVRIIYQTAEDPDIETAIDRWLRSLLDSPATSRERQKP